MRGVELAADPDVRAAASRGRSAKVYWNAIPEPCCGTGSARLREAGDQTFFEGMDPDADEMPSFVLPDDLVTTSDRRHGPRRGQDGRDARARDADHRGRAVLRPVEQPRQPGAGASSTTAWSGDELGTERDADGREADLFAGL